jgi:MFS family permease
MSTDTDVEARPPDGVLAAFRATPPAVRHLLAGVLVNQLGAFVQTFLVLYLTVSGRSAGDAGLALTAYGGGAVVGTLVGGELTHRLGPRLTIVASMAVAGPLVASIPWLTGHAPLGVLLVDVAAGGLATQAYRPAAGVLLSDLMPEHLQVMAFAMLRTALNTGAVLAPLLAAGLILVDWDLLYWLDGATSLAYAGLALVLLPAVAAPPEAGAAPPEADAAAPAPGRSAYPTLVRDRRFLCFLLAVVLGTVAYTQSTAALPLELLADRYPTSLYSGVLVLSSALLILCELKVTTYVTRLPRALAVGLGHGVNSAGLLCYALAAHSPAFVLLGAGLNVSGVIIAGPSMFAHPATFPAAVKARSIAAMQAVAGLAMTLGPIFGVLTWHALGSSFWTLIALLNAVAGVLAMVALTSRPVRSAPVPTSGEPA